MEFRHEGKKLCSRGAGWVACGLTHPPDMTSPLASRKKAPRPLRRARTGDGGRTGRVARERREKARKFRGDGGFIFRVFSRLSRAIPAFSPWASVPLRTAECSSGGGEVLAGGAEGSFRPADDNFGVAEDDFGGSGGLFGGAEGLDGAAEVDFRGSEVAFGSAEVAFGDAEGSAFTEERRFLTGRAPRFRPNPPPFRD